MFIINKKIDIKTDYMKNPNVVLIIQARMGSSRLPGKSILDLAGVPLIGRILERVKRSKSFQKIVLAIPDKKEDDVLKKIGQKYRVNVFRGSENNLLDRYYKAAKIYQADYVARLPADNPLPEVREMDKLINHHLALGRRGFSSNLAPFFNSGYPDGIGVEVFDFSLLEEAYLNNKDPKKNEHVHLNFFDYESEKAVDSNWCPISTINCPKDISRPKLVLDVNTYSQYIFIKEIYDFFMPKNKFFNINDIIYWYENIYLEKSKDKF